MFCFLIQYEMEWKPIWSDSGARSMRPQGTPGIAPNRSTQNGTKPPTWFFGRWWFSEEWGGNWTSWLQNILKIAFMLPEWWKGPTASERVFIIWDVACAQNGIQHWTFSPKTSIWESSSSLLNQLWFIPQNGKMKWANFQLFFRFFSCLILFRSNMVHIEGKFRHALYQVQTLTKDLGCFLVPIWQSYDINQGNKESNKCYCHYTTQACITTLSPNSKLHFQCLWTYFWTR